MKRVSVGLIGLFGALLINAALLVGCFWGATLLPSGVVWLLVVSCAAGFHLWLGAITVRVWVLASQVAGVLDFERVEAQRLALDGCEIERELREARSGDEPASLDWSRGGLLAAGRSYICRRYIAGEALHLDGLRAALRDHALDLLDPLQELEFSAYKVGIAGTLAGFGIQVFVTQRLGIGSVLDHSFLIGLVVKASASLTGGVAGAYAHRRRRQLLNAGDAEIDAIEQLAVRQASPLFTTAAAGRGDAGAILTKTAEAIDKMVKGLGKDLSDVLTTKFNDAVENGITRMKQFAAEDFAASLRTQVGEVLQTQITAAAHALSTAASGIESGTTGLGAAAESLSRQIRVASDTAAALGASVQQVCSAAAGAAASFDGVSSQARNAAEIIMDSAGEVSAAVAASRGPADLQRQVEDLLAELKRVVGDLGQTRAAVERAAYSLTAACGQERRP